MNTKVIRDVQDAGRIRVQMAKLAPVVIDHGQVAYTGTPEGFVDRAQGRVWVSDEPDPRAELSWRAGDGRLRHIGDPPTAAELIAPTLEDAYLLEVGRDAEEMAA